MAIPEKPMEIYYFDQWGKEVNSEEDVIVTKEEIEREIEALKDVPVCENVGEIFKTVL
jgi:hypothetical protein